MLVWRRVLVWRTSAPRSDKGMPSALPISLSDVQLATNRLSAVPPALLVLTNLTKLDLSDNSLELLPNDFGRLAALVHLDLSNNGLKTLPASVAQLIALQTLTLTNNELTSLPTTVRIGRCFWHACVALTVVAAVAAAAAAAPLVLRPERATLARAVAQRAVVARERRLYEHALVAPHRRLGQRGIIFLISRHCSANASLIGARFLRATALAHTGDAVFARHR